MNWLVNFAVNHAGLGKAWEFMDGKKTYAAAVFGVLTSLVGLGTELAPILASHNALGLWGFVQRLPSDPSWLSLVASFGLLGLGHKIVKASGPEIP